jgi:hypothetical protein
LFDFESYLNLIQTLLDQFSPPGQFPSLFSYLPTPQQPTCISLFTSPLSYPRSLAALILTHFSSRPAPLNSPPAQPTSTVVVPGHDLRETKAKGRILVPYEIFTESEPIWIKVGLEIESNLLVRSPTEKPYKKSPRRSSIPSNLAANPSLAPHHRCAAPPPFPTNRSLVEHHRNSVAPLECTPS